MSRKLLTLLALGLVMQATPVLADDHEGGKGPKHGGMFEKHDTDGDGVISKAEFLAQAEERFGKMDADSDGKVTPEEAKASHEEMREKMKEKRKEWKERKGGEEKPAE